KVTKIVDKLAKVHIIHKNKANNLKSKMALYINKLA
ncbi:30S ribosomal protein S20, partial [termite gut metagenome]